jgi:hypothetical protein
MPVYVGQSREGIRKRVSRHLTSARSDIVANKMIDIWEVAYVWAYSEDGDLDRLEAFLFHHFRDQGDITLFNGAWLPDPNWHPGEAPEPIVVQVLPSDEIKWRRQLSNRVTRQAQHFAALLDVFLGVKPESHIARALEGHFTRLSLYHTLLQTPFVDDTGQLDLLEDAS